MHVKNRTLEKVRPDWLALENIILNKFLIMQAADEPQTGFPFGTEKKTSFISNSKHFI